MATWTQEDIDALKEAIKGGVRKVKYAGPPERELEYQSLSEMRELLASMTNEVAAAPRYRRVSWSKGFR